MNYSRTLTFFLFCLLFVFAVGCTRSETVHTRWRQENGKVKVLTTIAMIHDLVVEIGGDRVDSIALIRGELDPHSYELVKGDDEKFARADLIFYNGLGLEHGLSLRQNLEKNPKAISVAQPILQNNPELILTIDGQYDPHVWMDIALWMKVIDPIVAALQKHDPDHAEEYQTRAASLIKKMQAADEQVFHLLQNVPAQRRYLVTSHDAFHYFTRHYLALPEEKEWQARCRAPEGLAPEAHMSVNDVIDLIAYIERYGVRVLFPESNVSRDSLSKILDASRQKGLNLRICQEVLYGDSMGESPSYLEMIIHNGSVMAREFNHE